MKEKKITISIVVYKELLSNLIVVINKFYEENIFNKLFIVDNSPTDELKSIKKHFPNIIYIFNDSNLGYGSAHNIAIKESIKCGIKYHIVLNPDVLVRKEDLFKLVDYMEHSPDVGLVMPKVFYPDGKLQYLCKLLPTPMDLFVRRFVPLKKYLSKRDHVYELRFTDYNKTMEVPYLSGCFMLMRTSVLERVGLFDESFFMYLEDTDLCRRIGEASKTVYYPNVEIVHNFEKGSYKNIKLLINHIISAIKYFNKWGWFFDKERDEVNKKTLITLGYKRKRFK